MHGRPRKRVEDPAADAESKANAELFQSLLDTLLKNFREKCFTKEALEDNAKLVQLNPDLYTAWNFRKVALKHLLGAEPDEDARKTMIDEELKVNENALKSHIKSYVSWHHRRWLIEFGLSSLDHELQLLAQLFKVDGRNFHAWDYRRFIVSVKGVSVQDELDYTKTLINKSFSNYSAWHNRSALLLELLKDKTDVEKESIFSEEFELVKQALYIDPADQSGWFYHSWLLGHSYKADRLVTEIEMCRELLQAEEEDVSDWARNVVGEESKFVRLTLARLLHKLNQSSEQKEEILELYDRLIKSDPAHTDYYKDMQRLVRGDG